VRAPLPVVSVGNISFGGTEKTPLAIDLLSRLRELGLKPALVSRGYKGGWERAGGVVSDGHGLRTDWREAGDEPALVGRKVPGAGVFVGKRRLDSCRKAHELGFRVAVLDDGFQHRRLHRDLDIVLVNPAGRPVLREPLSSLARADLVLVRNGRGAERIGRFLTADKILAYRVRPDGYARPGANETLPSEFGRGKRVFAFCGIARPERFFELLEQSGALIRGRRALPDHCAYPPRSRRRLRAEFEASGAELAVTTEKDAIKLDPPGEFLAGFPIYALKIKTEAAAPFYERVQAALKPFFPEL